MNDFVLTPDLYQPIGGYAEDDDFVLTETELDDLLESFEDDECQISL